MTIHANILSALQKCPSYIIPLSHSVGLSERDDEYLADALQELEEWGLVEFDEFHGYRITEGLQ